LIKSSSSLIVNSTLPDFKGFLLYGNNLGKIEYCYDRIISCLIVKNFKKILLNSDELNKDKLMEAVNTYNNNNLFDDKFSLVLYLKNNALNSELIKLISGPELLNIKLILKFQRLEKSSALRKFFESSNDFAIVPCYENTDSEKIQIIKEQALSFGLHLSDGKVLDICKVLGNSEVDIRKELEKILILEKKNLDRKQFVKQYYYNETSFVFDVVSGKPFLYSDFNRYTDYGKNQIYLINSLIEHFFKLLVVKGVMIKGENMFSALRGLKPPIFFKFEKQFISQVSEWSVLDIRETIKKLFYVQRLFLNGALSSNSNLLSILLEFSSKKFES